ncbi:nucleoside diphosphate kinase regulator [Silicimonas algicola]|uniref:Regulator of nucleoside diphosphate kinase n=1 Tax=Silicimonas algicola TaxID=1826607 RepID=A0A316G7S0_9RHOB|nr:nucleoside diphosphate kinase regulator [Silicimonas algicola]AZQ68687.1 nucleoside diphosphate kinase regulator [Silicimonas algicola]PWK56245.1 regulator of nucleoside diphosphate kinase [Silicimonas algicola]
MTLPRSASRDTARRPRIIIGANCLDRLEALAEGAIRRNPDLADRLLDEIVRARIVPMAKLPPYVVAIGRAVTYRDETTGQEKTVTLVFPEDADIARGRISILTPIGVALIGLAEGASLHWEIRDGKRRVLTVLRVDPHDAAEGQKVQ